MTRCLLRLVLVAAVLQGCFLEDKEWTLDRVIPRIETPTSQIAYIGTTWVNNYHRQTTLYDRQGRVLETFAFGRSSYKTLNQYDGAKNTLTIHYNCSDSEPSGEMNVDTVRRIFDKTEKLVADKQTFIHFYSRSRQTVGGSVWRSFAYNAVGDTMITRRTYSDPKLNHYVKTQQTNIDRWEHDRPGRAVRHYRLNIIGGNRLPPDTIHHYSQRFAYDSSGRQVMAWFEFMHLGRFYMPAGPDTIRYAYDQQGRVVREVHRYTTDKRNKREVDVRKLPINERKGIELNKRRFYEGEEFSSKNDKTDLVEHRYEPFDLKKHVPLRMPTELGY